MNYKGDYTIKEVKQVSGSYGKMRTVHAISDSDAKDELVLEVVWDDKWHEGLRSFSLTLTTQNKEPDENVHYTMRGGKLTDQPRTVSFSGHLLTLSRLQPVDDTLYAYITFYEN